ncbi:hypothetical protein K3495_g453 [Podosphaera aphanis]|nr:hypothetical protein K3495_g453 [Podosphaera aphanis]
MLSDRGPQAIYKFWAELNQIFSTKIKLSNANHPQTDGQTEIYNQYLQKRLRPYVNYYQNNWSELLPMMDCALLTLPHNSLGGLSLFGVVHGYPARIAWDWKLTNESNPADKFNIEDARLLARKQHEAWSLARKHLLQAQTKMKSQSDRHRRPVDFKVGDYVWLDLRHFQTQRPSKKLYFPYNGKFLITEQVSNSFRFALSDTFKIHNVFPPEKLRLASADPLPDQINDQPFPINVTGDDKWEVEDILASRIRRNRLEYRAAWGDKDVDLDLIPASDFKYAPHKIKDFHPS